MPRLLVNLLCPNLFRPSKIFFRGVRKKAPLMYTLSHAKGRDFPPHYATGSAPGGRANQNTKGEENMLILISDAFDPSLPGRLQAFGEVTEDPARLSEASVVLVRSKTKCTTEYIDGAPKLKLIIRGGVGVDNIDTKYAASKGIAVRNTPKASSITVAELAFAMMIAPPTRLVEGHMGVSEGRWEKDTLKRTELFGKTLAIVGMGNIATEIARRATAFGMKVKAFRKSGAPSPDAQVVSTLQEALAGADYVSLHTPLTDETRGMINRDTLAIMKKGAVLINTARAAIVVPEDVKAALESGQLAWYCTDVWPKDPPAEDYPLLRAPHVLMAPHIGGNSKENLLRIGDEVVDIIGTMKKEGTL